MGERKEICLKKAAECERMAVLVSDETIRSVYLDLAKQWLRMAKDAEELERRFSHLAIEYSSPYPAPNPDNRVIPGRR